MIAAVLRGNSRNFKLRELILLLSFRRNTPMHKTALRSALSTILFLSLILVTGVAQAPKCPACPATAPVDPYQPVPYVKIKHPEWSKNASIYQINTRAVHGRRHLSRRRAATAAPESARRRNSLAHAHQPHRPEEPQGHARQPIRRAGLPQGQSRVRHPRRLSSTSSPPPTSRACTSSSTGSPITQRGTTSSSPSIPIGTPATGRAISAPRRGGTGPTSSTSTTPSPGCAST